MFTTLSLGNKCISGPHFVRLVQLIWDSDHLTAGVVASVFSDPQIPVVINQNDPLHLSCSSTRKKANDLLGIMNVLTSLRMLTLSFGPLTTFNLDILHHITATESYKVMTCLL